MHVSVRAAIERDIPCMWLCLCVYAIYAQVAKYWWIHISKKVSDWPPALQCLWGRASHISSLVSLQKAMSQMRCCLTRQSFKEVKVRKWVGDPPAIQIIKRYVTVPKPLDSIKKSLPLQITARLYQWALDRWHCAGDGQVQHPLKWARNLRKITLCHREKKEL